MWFSGFNRWALRHPLSTQEAARGTLHRHGEGVEVGCKTVVVRSFSVVLETAYHHPSDYLHEWFGGGGDEPGG